MHIQPRFLAFTIYLALIGSTSAQDVPDTDIYLFDIAQHEGHINVSNMVKVTDRPGYDNQPFFTPDSKGLLFTSVRDSLQADIYRYDLTTGETRQLTNTPESEYSPMISPKGKNITAVRVEQDSTQRIWKFKLDGSNPKVLMKDVTDIGYYCWLNKKKMAIWTVKDTMLSIAQVKKQEVQPLLSGTGRSFQLSPTLTKLVYIRKQSSGIHRVMQYNFVSGVTDSLVTTFPKEEDIAFHPSGELLIGHRGSVHSFLPGSDTDWQPYVDLRQFKVLNFYRMAVSPDGTKLAVVAYTGDKP